MSKYPHMRRAVILAGGRGTRLRPYTLVLPKPLMPIGEFPILELIVRQLASYGYTHITMAVNHQAQLIQAFFGDGSRWNLTIDYSLETTPLSTIGPLTLIPDLPEHFLLMNGDILTDLDFGDFLSSHIASRNLFTISASQRTERIDYGVLHVADAGALTGFEEKPVHQYLVSMGVYAVSSVLLSFVPRRQHYGFDHLMGDMLTSGRRVDVHVHPGYWLDIGRPDDYAQAVNAFESTRTRFLGD